MKNRSKKIGRDLYEHADGTICWFDRANTRLWNQATSGKPCSACNEWVQDTYKNWKPQPVEPDFFEELKQVWAETKADMAEWWIENEALHPVKWRLRWVYPSWWLRAKDG